MRINRLRPLVVLAAVLAVMFAGSPPAGAHGQGVLNFEGAVHLPALPCPSPGPGEDPCAGSFEGVAGGALGGVHEGVEWTAVVDGAALTALFSYFDFDCTQGAGSGRFSLTASAANEVTGFYADSTIPKPVVGVTIEGEIAFRRVGNTIVHQVNGGTIQLDVFGGGLVNVATTLTGHGVSTMSATSIDPASCLLETGPPVDADVVGFSSLAQPGVD